MPKTQRIAGVAVGMMLLVWTCILHIPRALAAPPASQRNEWIAVFEAMAFAGIALVLTQKRVQNKACERSTDETGGLALSK